MKCIQGILCDFCQPLFRFNLCSNTSIVPEEMAPEYVISGSVAPGYEPVKEMFEKNFENGTEEHSQLCAYVKGEKVVDLWGTVDKTRNQLNSLTHTGLL